MNLLQLGIIFQICFVIAPKVIVPLENDSGNFQDSPPSLDNVKDDMAPPTNESAQGENQSVESTPEVTIEPNTTVKDGDKTKIPMTCISDYEEYCQSKFDGFQFQDGCHKCRCTKQGKDFCDKGPCEFNAPSINEAQTYCTKVNEQNENDYRRQLQDIQSPSNNQTTAIKDKKETHKEEMPLKIAPTKPTVKNETVKSDSINQGPLKTDETKPSNDFKEINENVTQNDGNLTQTETERGASKNVTELLGQTDDKQQSDANSEKELDKVMDKKTVIQNETGKRDLITDKNDTKLEKKLYKMENKGTVIVNLIDKVDRNGEHKGNETKFEKVLNKMENKNTETKRETLKTHHKQKGAILIKAMKKNSIHKSIKDRGKNIHDKVNPLKSSLDKMSDKKILRNIIYFIAHNELSIERVLKKMKDYPQQDKVTELFLKRLTKIQEENSKFKAKILEIVKTKLKLTKSNYGPFHHRFDPMFFKRVVKKLSKLNEELHKMKGGVKMWKKMSKKAYLLQPVVASGADLKVSLTVIFVSVIVKFL